MGCNFCPDVVKVEALPDLMLKVWFADGKVKLCDCHELSQTRPFRKIQNKYFFSLAKADHWGCVTWPGERDLAPEYLYYDIGVEINEDRKGVDIMPPISIFLGIIITMNWSDHNPPHFHASYQGYEAVFDFDGDLLEGEMPRRQQRFIAAWVELHRQELEENWEDAWANKPLTSIRGLR